MAMEVYNCQSTRGMSVFLHMFCGNCIRTRDTNVDIDKCTNVVIGCNKCRNQDSFPLINLLHNYLLDLANGGNYPECHKWDGYCKERIKGYRRLT